MRYMNAAGNAYALGTILDTTLVMYAMLIQMPIYDALQI